MGCYHSQKCTKEELEAFKNEVVGWLNKNFSGWDNKFKLRAFNCYGGDVRLYDGEYMEMTNSKSSFRRESEEKDEKGNVVGYHGTRGLHTTRIPQYITINKDEFPDMKKALVEGDDFFEDYIFNKLRN